MLFFLDSKQDYTFPFKFEASFLVYDDKLSIYLSIYQMYCSQASQRVYKSQDIENYVDPENNFYNDTQQL